MNTTASTGFRWLMLFTMLLVSATAAIFLVAPTSLLPLIFRTMSGLKPQQIIFATMGGFQIFMVIAMIFSGPLLDRFGVLKIYIGGLLLMGCGGLLMPVFGNSLPGMLSLRLLQALGTGPVLVSAIPIAAKYFHAPLRTAVIIVQSLAMMVGIIIGLKIVPIISQGQGSPLTTLAWLALATIPGLIVSLLAMRHPGRRKNAPGGERLADMNRFRQALSHPAIWGILVCLALAGWISSSKDSVFLPYFTADAPAGLGYGPSGASGLMAIAGIVGFFGGVIGMLLTELSLKGNIRPVVLAGFIVPAIFFFLAGRSSSETSLWILWCYVLATCFTIGFVTPQVLGYIAKYFPVNITGTMGGLAMGIAGFIGKMGLLASTTIQQASGYQLLFNMMAGIAVLGILSVLFLRGVGDVP